MVKAPSARRQASATHSVGTNVLPPTNKNRIHPYSPVQPNAGASATPWRVGDLCKAYDWPSNLDGGGIIAIIALGGGWVPSDVSQFFDSQDLKGLAPHVTDHSVDGITQNSKCNPPSDADAEVALDIELAAAAYAVATGKAATIRVYWAQGIQGAIAGVRAATDDECDVCCITWGADEQKWGEDAAWAFEQAAEAATAAGMVIFAASGDNDSSDGGLTPANVDLPASAPHVIACGGTTKPRNLQESEKVWNDTLGDPSGRGTGGGFSTIFRIPAWQIGTLQAEMRMVPDVAANADPNVGYEIYVNQSARIVGGTSAATALYTGLFASFTPKLGFIIPELYKNQVCFNDIQEGDNGQFRALVGPDACSGLGSPKASRLWNVVGSPLVTYQRRLREKNEEISRLRGNNNRIDFTGRGQLAPRDVPAISRIPCNGGSVRTLGLIPPSQPQVQRYAVQYSNWSTIPNPSASTLVADLMKLAPNDNPGYELAANVVRNVPKFQSDQLSVDPNEIAQATYLIQFVWYILDCYNTGR
jgi:kumamolisin